MGYPYHIVLDIVVAFLAIVGLCAFLLGCMLMMAEPWRQDIIRRQREQRQWELDRVRRGVKGDD